MKAALSEDMLATDIAEYLVRKNVPFRNAHHIAGQAVLLAEQHVQAHPTHSLRQAFLSITREQWKTLHQSFGDDIMQESWWSFERSVESRASIGGTARNSVQDQISSLRAWNASLKTI
jgi:argininosuccinate lyase